MTKGPIHQEDTTILNLYATNNIKKFKEKLTELQEKLTNPPYRRDFNILFSELTTQSKKKSVSI